MWPSHLGGSPPAWAVPGDSRAEGLLLCVWSLGLQQPPPTNLTPLPQLRAGQRSLGGSAPVAIPGCLPRSPSLHSSSSLSASPLGSFSQSLPGPLISSAMTPPQQPPPLKSEPRALGPSVSSYNSFGEWPCGAPGWGEPQCSPSCPVAAARLHVPWGQGLGFAPGPLGGSACLGPHAALGRHSDGTRLASQAARRTKSAEAKHRSRWICRIHLQMETCDLF